MIKAPDMGLPHPWMLVVDDLLYYIEQLLLELSRTKCSLDDYC